MRNPVRTEAEAFRFVLIIGAMGVAVGIAGWLGGGWVALGRWNYSLRDKQTLESLLGAEYNADCWSLRIVAHRFTIATGQYSSSFFVQLELNGVSRIGSSPLDVLRRNIGGYFQVDPRVRRPGNELDPFY